MVFLIVEGENRLANRVNWQISRYCSGKWKLAVLISTQKFIGSPKKTARSYISEESITGILMLCPVCNKRCI